MLYLELFISFFKIGLFSFGGGYAMIPLISEEIASHGWMSQADFVQIIGIAEMTPGPIAVNSATFIGFQTGGILGSVVATIGVASPSILIILFISGILFRYITHPMVKKILYGIRPAIAALICYAAFSIIRTTLLTENWQEVLSSGNIGYAIGHLVNYVTLGILVIIGLVHYKWKPHPILLIGLAGGLGAISHIFL